jgi:hypothetical protein
MQDRPTAVELLTSVREFIEQDVLPGLEGRKRFHALVSANVLAIVARELAGEETMLVAEWERLQRLLDGADAVPTRLDDLKSSVDQLTRRLCDRIRAGDADVGVFGEAVRTHVRATVVDKLRIANPKYLGEGG